MPDWEKLVSERLGTTGLMPKERADVVAELAAHVEDLYEEKFAKDLSEQEAIKRAFGLVPNWCELSRKISRAKLRGMA
jgi:hypothetical protein